MSKCYYHEVLKNATEFAEKCDKINNEQWKKFIEGIKKINKLLDQTNSDLDKNMLVKNKKAICKKVLELALYNCIIIKKMLN